MSTGLRNLLYNLGSQSMEIDDMCILNSLLGVDVERSVQCPTRYCIEKSWYLIWRRLNLIVTLTFSKNQFQINQGLQGYTCHSEPSMGNYKKYISQYRLNYDLSVYNLFTQEMQPSIKKYNFMNSSGYTPYKEILFYCSSLQNGRNSSLELNQLENYCKQYTKISKNQNHQW